MNKLTSLIKSDRLIRILIIIGICFVIVAIVFYILYKVHFERQLNNNEITFFIGSIKDIFQTIFFILIGVLTILSYLQARKTLFTPIKTETFKLQIRAFEDILAFFQTKSEFDFARQFDYDFIVESNAQIMFTDFCTRFYKNEIKIDEEKLKNLYKEFYGAIVSEKHMLKIEYYTDAIVEKEEDVTNPAIILDKWKSYEYGPINYSKKFDDETNKLNQLIASPLIPTELRNKLEEFDRGVRDNLYIIRKVLNDIAQELPQKFTTVNSLKKFEPNGIWNRYNQEKKVLEPKAKEILTYIRQYLKIDKLVE